MRQLDVVLSPPAFVWSPYLTLAHVNWYRENRLVKKPNNWRQWILNCLPPQKKLFILRYWQDFRYGSQHDIWPWPMWPVTSRAHVKDFFLVNYYLVTFGIVTDKQTEAQMGSKCDLWFRTGLEMEIQTSLLCQWLTFWTIMRHHYKTYHKPHRYP